MASDGMATPSKPCTWWAFFSAGLLFPLHIVVGLASVPAMMWRLARGDYVAWVLFLTYMPFYLYPAQWRIPGWKLDRFWKIWDIKNSALSYNGEFAVHVTEKFDPEQHYFVGCHPHGTMIFQRIFWLVPDLRNLFTRDYRMLCASVLFRVPLMREMTLFFGGVDASKTMVERIIKSGNNVVLYPGGLDEANSVDATKKVQLRTRSGFIRMAAQHGMPVLPTFCFGELDAVSAVPVLPSPIAKFIQQTFRMSSTFFVGRWGTFIPRRVPFNLVIGRPIATKQIADGPELDAEVTRVHEAFKAELRSIYESNKERFGYADRELVFTCEQRKGEQTGKVKTG